MEYGVIQEKDSIEWDKIIFLAFHGHRDFLSVFLFRFQHAKILLWLILSNQMQ